jgi:hypothetical protein
MKLRIKRNKDKPLSEFLLLRKQLGMERLRKGSKRYEEKRKILIELALKKIEEKENVQETLDDFYRLQVLRLLAPEPDIRARIMLHSFGEALTNPKVSSIVKDNWEEMNGRLEKIIIKAQEYGWGGRGKGHPLSP